MPKTIFDSGRTLAAKSFSLLRDFEEAFGWIVTLVSDRRGTFLVQRSLFNKNCYAKHIINYNRHQNRPPETPHESTATAASALPANNSDQNLSTDDENEPGSNSRPTTVPPPHQTIQASSSTAVHAGSLKAEDLVINGVIINSTTGGKFSLAELKKMKETEQKALFDKIACHKDLAPFGGADSFLKQLAAADENNLKNVKIDDLSQIGSIRVALLSYEEIKKLTLRQLPDYNGKALYARLNDTHLHAEPRPKNTHLLDLTISHFRTCSGTEISANIKDIPDYVFSIVSDQQIKSGLDLSQASSDQIVELTSLRNTPQTFAVFSSTQVQTLLDGTFNLPQNIQLVSDEQLKGLNFKDFYETKIKRLLIDPKLSGSSKQSEKKQAEYVRKRIELLPDAQVQNILTKIDDLSCYAYRAERSVISGKLLPKLDLKSLNAKQLHALLLCGDEKYNRDRFAKLQHGQVQSILPHLLTAPIKSALPQLDSNSLAVITDKQFAKLELSTLSKEQLAIIFKLTNGIEERRRFQLLPEPQRKAILAKLDPVKFGYLK